MTMNPQMQAIGAGILAAVSLAAGVSALSWFSTRGSADSFANMVQEVSTATSELYRVQPAATRYGTAVIDHASLIETGSINRRAPWVSTATGTIANPFSGTVVITGANSQYTIDTGGVPRQNCIKFLTETLSSNLIISAAAAADISALGSATPQTLPYDPPSARTACNGDTRGIRIIGGS